MGLDKQLDRVELPFMSDLDEKRDRIMTLSRTMNLPAQGNHLE